MRVHERWREYARDGAFWALFDDAMFDLAGRIVRERPGGPVLHPILYPPCPPRWTAAQGPTA